MKEEEKLTYKEWERIQRDNQVVSRYQILGLRIDSIELLRRIMHEIHISCDPNIWDSFIQELRRNEEQ
jgi:hypothetical protein